MNKFILSTVVIMAFIIYAFSQRVTPVVIPESVNSAVTVSTSSGNTNGSSSSPQVKPVPVSSPVIIPKPTPIPTPTSTPVITPPVVINEEKYKDGVYTGSSANAYYGNIQVQVVIQGGKITDVVFLDHPQDRSTSVRINNHAMPILKSEVIQIQDSNVDTVSGATFTSGAFRKSLASALTQALN